MENLVQFRLSVDTLTQDEFATLIKSVHKDEIVHALFDYHLKQLQNNECHKIKDINNKISEIINFRNDHNQDAMENPSLPSPQLNNIPTPLINYIDLYLENNIHFQQTCRSIYIASKSPQNILKIDLNQIVKYINYCNKNNERIDKNKFNRVNVLRIYTHFDSDDGPEGLKLWNNNGFIANNVSKLELYCVYEDDKVKSEISRFLTLNHVNLNKVNQLEIFEVNFPMSEIIEKTPNLQYLDLIELRDLGQLSEQSKTILQQLKGININYGTDASNITNLCGTQLESLHININLPDTFKKFVNLKELSIRVKNDTNLTEIDSTIQNFTQLKTIYLRFDRKSFPDEMVKFLNALFSINSLETVKFEIDGSDWEVMCQILQQSLITIDKSKLNISIKPMYDTVNNHIDCLSLVNALNTAVTNDFMFHFQNHSILKEVNEKIRNNIQKTLDRCKQKFHVEYKIDKKTISFVLCNKQSKINGYNAIKTYFDNGSIF